MQLKTKMFQWAYSKPDTKRFLVYITSKKKKFPSCFFLFNLRYIVSLADEFINNAH